MSDYTPTQQLENATLRIIELEYALSLALSCIEGLFGQQAMPDDCFDADVEEIKSVLDNRLHLD